ncbi:MAG: transcriptional regulator [Oscillospiraceae bacterium]|nr:transcriptional regulator [Oscillospiraceae bacterium]
MLRNKDTAGSLLREYLKKGYVERVRRDLYAVISLETKQPVSSRYQIGCAVFPDAVIVNHSAFEIYGYANQVFNEVYVSSASRFSDFSYNGISYHRIAPKGKTVADEIGGVRVSSLEQTVVDGISDFEKVAGLEELLRCIMLIPSLREEKLIGILTARRNGFLWQKCGYILEELNAGLALSESFFRTCRSHMAGSKRPLIRDDSISLVWNKTWDLYVPQSLRSIIDKGVHQYDTI